MKSVTAILSRKRGPAVWVIVLVAACALICISITAQEKKAGDRWSQWRFLLGDWVSAPDSTGAIGGTTFSLDLQDQILVRRNFAKYPARDGKPAVNHEDLLVIWQQPGNPAEANYWDNEGHVIHYFSTFSDNGDTLRLVSDINPNAPRFRLSYIRVAMDSLQVNFDFAPPGKPDAFQQYLQGRLQRK